MVAGRGSSFADVWFGLGANLGDAPQTLKDALRAIGLHAQIEVKKVSSFYRSAPVDATGPDFINAVAYCQTSLAPLDFLHALQCIENQFGRQRPYYHAPRTLDLDVLLYNDVVLDTVELILPHAAMHERAFVLLPLYELAPELTIPGKGYVKVLLSQVEDQAIERLALSV